MIFAFEIHMHYSHASKFHQLSDFARSITYLTVPQLFMVLLINFKKIKYSTYVDRLQHVDLLYNIKRNYARNIAVE